MNLSASPQTHVVVVGGLNMDLVVRVPTIPRPGETIQGYSFATFPGGKGANQAVAAARLGARVSIIGSLGQDAFGQELQQALHQEGIDASQVAVIDPATEDTPGSAATGVALITVEDSGQNNISVASGANMTLTPERVQAALQAVGPFDWLLMPLEVPLPTLIAAARTARQLGAQVLLNPAPAQPLPSELLQHVNILAPNEFEATTLTSMPVTSEQQAATAAQYLSSLAPQASILITRGEQGVLVRTPDGQTTHLPAFKVKVVDTTAAGDAFVAGLAVASGEGQDLVTAARFASAAGALAVTRAGAQPSLPTRSAVMELLQ